MGVFIDLRKVFDTIKHDLLLKKLENVGVRSFVSNWFSTSLNNRKQYVALDNVPSSLSTAICGVPQSSVLGPFFVDFIH